VGSAPALPGLWRFNESDIRAGLQEALRTFDRLVDAEGRSRVGATDDHELGVDPRLDGSTQAQQHLVSGDDRLAFEVPAALRSHLILDENAGGSGPLELTDGPLHVHQIAVSGVAVRDERNRQTGGHAPYRFRHLSEREKVQVRQRQGAGRHAEPAGEQQRNTGTFQEQGGERVVRSQGGHNAGRG